jgi:hypothetical protein
MPDNGPEVLVDADGLWRDYFGNPFSADTKYLNRQFAVELRPFQIARLPDGSPTFLYRAWGETRIRASFQASEVHKIAVLNKGIDSAIVIRGTCDGLQEGIVRMSQCTIDDQAQVIAAPGTSAAGS